jgi:predicted ATPase
MRSAEAEKYLEKLVSAATAWPSRIVELSFESLGTIGTATIPIELPVTVLCGFCGAGKSTVLRSVWAALDPESASFDERLPLKLGTGGAKVTVARKEGQFEFGVTLAGGEITGPGYDHDVTLLESGDIVSSTAQNFSATAGLAELVEGFQPLELTHDTLDDVRYLLRREYESVRVYEVELADTVLPFFCVNYLGHEYDSRTMGSGELSTLTLWWAIERSTEGEILLIEEPESFVSSASQNALVEHISREALRKKLNVIMTSHSPAIILRLPEGSGRFLVRTTAGVQYEPHPLPELRARIGIQPTRLAVIYVEDRVAAAFARAWLAWGSPQLSAICEIRVAADGVSDIEMKMKHLPGDLSGVRFFGLADGDARDEIAKDLAAGRVRDEVVDKIGFLPGDKAPEMILMECAVENAIALGEDFGKDVPQLLAALEGKDKHDWFLDFSRTLGLPPPQIVSTLFSRWVSSEKNEKLAREAFTGFEEKLGHVLK